MRVPGDFLSEPFVEGFAIGDAGQRIEPRPVFFQIQLGMQILRFALEVGDALAHVFGTSVVFRHTGRLARAEVADLPGDRLEACADGGLQHPQFRGRADFVGEFSNMQHHRVVERLRVIEVAAARAVRLGQETRHFLETHGHFRQHGGRLQAFARQRFAALMNEIGGARHDRGEFGVGRCGCQLGNQILQHRSVGFPGFEAFQQRT